MTRFFFDVDSEDITFLKDQWDNLTSFHPSNEIIKEEIFQILKDKYTETSRAYHNLSHIKTLLNLLESFRSQIQDYDAIRFSIWFHDVIYDTKRNDNEEESASLASKMMKQLHVNSEIIHLVRDLILATKAHDDRNLPRSAKLFLDMDLAILGTSEEIYKEYGQAIRKEYAWASESAYREGRHRVLKSFIERDRIYITDEMQARYEGQARKNIHTEIKTLDSQEKTHA